MLQATYSSFITAIRILFFFFRISFINQEARLLWPGNSKIHIKGNANTRLKMEELVTRMEPMCSIPEIGFGRGKVYIANFQSHISAAVSYILFFID